jgi:glutathione S-transferase
MPASGAALYPAALHERFAAERWMDWQQTTLIRGHGAAAGSAAAERVRRYWQVSRHCFEPLLSILDQRVATQRFIAGERFTMAASPSHAKSIATGAYRASIRHPRLERWYVALLERPATRSVLATYGPLAP